jgi:Transposase DDE domain
MRKRKAETRFERYSTPLAVCHPARAHRHKVFENQVGWGKSSTGWQFGCKLHLIINDRGELLAFKFTPTHVDDAFPYRK